MTERLRGPYDPLLAGEQPFGQSPIPWAMPDGMAPHLPAPLRKYPEVLFALLAGLEPDARERIAEPLGLPDPSPWTLYQCLVFDAEPGEAKVAIEETEEEYRKPMRAAPEEAGPIRSLGTRVMLKLFQRHLNEYEQGAQSLTTLMRTVAIIYLDSSPDRIRVLEQVREDFRKVLETHYPTLLRIPIPGRDEPLTLLEIPSWIEEQAQKREALERSLRRAQQKVHELSRTLRRNSEDRIRARLQATNQQSTAAAGPPTQVAEKDTRRYLALRGHHGPPGGNDTTQVEEARQALEHERELHAETRAELRDLLDREVGADLKGESEQTRSIAGQRILLIGGVDQTLPDLEAAIGAENATLVHYDDQGQGVPASLIHSADVVVFKTRHLSHATYHAVKNICRTHEVPLRHWGERSPESLVRTLTRDPWAKAREDATQREEDTEST